MSVSQEWECLEPPGITVRDIMRKTSAVVVECLVRDPEPVEIAAFNGYPENFNTWIPRNIADSPAARMQIWINLVLIQLGLLVLFPYLRIVRNREIGERVFAESPACPTRKVDRESFGPGGRVVDGNRGSRQE